MGLCKCPRKKVTNQFCFEHATNVCEHCMVTEHPRCIIQSYLKWLDNSEYEPVCQVCGALLASGECVRLVCYDVFHKQCLDQWAQQLPPNTAPAGYKCPTCTKPVFPSSNLVSPVADELRGMLAAFPWARTGLGLPLIEEKSQQQQQQQQQEQQQDTAGEAETDWRTMNGAAVSDSSSSSSPHHQHSPTLQPHNTHPRATTHGGGGSGGGGGGSSSGGGVRVTAMEDPPITPSVFRDHHHHHQTAAAAASVATPSSSVTRKGSSSSSSDTRLLLLPGGEGVDADDSENKYKRRSAVEWFSRWWRTMHRPASRHHQGLAVCGVRRMVVVLVVLSVITVVVVLSYLGRGASDSDPMLDPFNNPNIHIEGE